MIRIKKSFTSLLLLGALGAPVAISVRVAAQDQRQEQRQEDRDRYVDTQGQEHHWDAHEDTAYRRYLKEKNRKYEDFHHLKKEQQEEYWQWRHDHPDAH